MLIHSTELVYYYAELVYHANTQTELVYYANTQH